MSPTLDILLKHAAIPESSSEPRANGLCCHPFISRSFPHMSPTTHWHHPCCCVLSRLTTLPAQQGTG